VHKKIYAVLLLVTWQALGMAVQAQPTPPAPPVPQAQPLAEDPVLEARLVDIAHELRCLVCQNETIAASHADLAVDLRNQIRQQLREGRSDEQIRAYMVERYGDFVLYRPPLKATTVLLWVGPFLLLGLGALVGWRVISTRTRSARPQPLTAAERERAERLLRGEGDTQ
jgi:cytochrome c-type biogenesis protein CcmH